MSTVFIVSSWSSYTDVDAIHGIGDSLSTAMKIVGVGTLWGVEESDWKKVDYTMLKHQIYKANRSGRRFTIKEYPLHTEA